MNTTTAPDPQDQTCPKCGRPFEVSTILTEDGNYQRVLQCWHCFTSTPGRKIMRIPLYAHQQQATATTDNLQLHQVSP
jgi:hypothetical protein